MKRALVNGQLTLAHAGAPETATCSDCGGVVELRNRQGTFFWRHVQLPRGGCSPQPAAASGTEPVAIGAGDAVTASDRERWTRQVGNLIIELHPQDTEADQPCLKLRGVGAETGESSEITINLGEVRPLAQVLIDAAADLAGTVLGDNE